MKIACIQKNSEVKGFYIDVKISAQTNNFMDYDWNHFNWRGNLPGILVSSSVPHKLRYLGRNGNEVPNLGRQVPEIRRERELERNLC
ncbi:hypothetical protein D3C81_1093310 [compost metagenome]